MALRHALLAALLGGEASGYELAKRFDVSVANFWSATPQQLYRELERLEQEGLLRAKVVRQRRRPDKRVFTVTDAGREELRAFTAQPARPAGLRDDLLVKLHAIDLGDVPAVREALTTRRERARAKLVLYDRLRDDLLAGRSEEEYLRHAERIGPYLTLLGGRMYEQQNIRWCTSVLGILDERHRDETRTQL
ncbi:MAG TPA: PadR family transcriptional regulator [Jiangellaceae bacterium]|nr:PadR family transcriptional regulator [Jiangellaceae bacterium]